MNDYQNLAKFNEIRYKTSSFWKHLEIVIQASLCVKRGDAHERNYRNVAKFNGIRYKIVIFEKNALPTSDIHFYLAPENQVFVEKAICCDNICCLVVVRVMSQDHH